MDPDKKFLKITMTAGRITSYAMVFCNICIIFILACGGDGPSPNTQQEHAGQARGVAEEKIQLALNWFPEAEHGGFYAAGVHGYYAELGLNVEIIPGGPGMRVLPMVARDTVDFGVSNADDLLLARAEGIPVVALLAPIQESPRCIMVHASSGIERLEDLSGRITLAMHPSAPFATYLRKQLPLEGVRQVPYTGRVTQFLADQNYAQQGYAFSEPIIASLKGATPRVLPVREIGYNPYTSILVVNEDAIRDYPGRVGRMVRACRLGWQSYLDDPTETNQHILGLNPEMDPQVLTAGVDAIRPLSLTEDVERTGFGTMEKSRWEELANAIKAAGMLEGRGVDIPGSFTNRFIGE
jgi:NitT/TauT family transport system substrate-binding protein